MKSTGLAKKEVLKRWEINSLALNLALKGYVGVFIPQPPKLAIVHLSSGGSEEISGHSEKYGHSERFSGYSEHSAEKAL